MISGIPWWLWTLSNNTQENLRPKFFSQPFQPPFWKMILFSSFSSPLFKNGRFFLAFPGFPACMDTLKPSDLGSNVTQHPSPKCFPPPFGLAKKRIYIDIHLKEEFIDFFWKLPNIPFPTGRVKGDVEHFANGNTTPTCKR